MIYIVRSDETTGLCKRHIILIYAAIVLGSLFDRRTIRLLLLLLLLSFRRMTTEHASWPRRFHGRVECVVRTTTAGRRNNNNYYCSDDDDDDVAKTHADETDRRGRDSNFRGSLRETGCIRIGLLKRGSDIAIGGAAVGNN